MESIKKIYRIGNGPSSSHTIGPRRAAEKFLSMEPTAKRYVVTLYGSLAATGKGHLTDKAIIDVLGKEKTEIIWKPTIFLPFHPNGMKYEAFDEKDNQIKKWIIYSIGGGKIADENTVLTEKQIYPHNTLTQILSFIEKEGMTFWEYVQRYEDSDIWDYLSEVWQVMQKSVEDGLQEEGVLPGSIHLRRKAMSYYTKARSYKSSLYGRCAVQAYALAVAEHNASGGR
jgi:L-serine dehydratase